MPFFSKYAKGQDIPLNTHTAHWLWNSDVGIVAPNGQRMSVKASVVVEPEVRQVDSSCSILLSQDCFGYSRFVLFCFCISIQIVNLFVLAL